MPTQVAKLDFWNHKNHILSDGVHILPPDNYVLKQSGGLLQANASLIAYQNAVNTYGETVYLKFGKYKSAALFLSNDSLNLTATTEGLNAINAENGFEAHQNSGGSKNYAQANAWKFSIDLKSFYVKWSRNLGLVLYEGVNPLVWDNASASDYNTNYTSGPHWSSLRLKAFVTNVGVTNTLFIQFHGVQAGNTVFGYKTIALANGVKPDFTALKYDNPDNTMGSDACVDNVSLYTISSSEASTYAGAMSQNKLMSFVRYAPMLDFIPVFGATWTGSDTPANPLADMVDGDLTTYATATAKGQPIGYVSSDGVATGTIADTEWYIVIAAGVGQDFSAVGGPASAALNDIFIATNTATLGGNYVYLLLTLGDIMGRCYFWTGGTLAALPTVGVIRNIGSMSFALASSDIEPIRYKAGTPVNGSNISAFDHVRKDILTAGDIAGETLAVNNFSSPIAPGEFTDGTNTHVFTTSQPIIFTIERKV